MMPWNGADAGEVEIIVGAVTQSLPKWNDKKAQEIFARGTTARPTPRRERTDKYDTALDLLR